MNDPVIQDLSDPDFGRNAEINKAIISAIVDGLTSFNALTHPDPAASPMVLAIHNESGHLIAGLLGRSAYDWLRIDIIWVATESRNQGIGSRLLRAAEEIALERGCRGVHLDTHAFQAPAFYEKHGYEVFGTLPDYPEGEDRYYFKKHLYSGEA